MFNRNARNRLNSMGGVASFQNGGLTRNPALKFGNIPYANNQRYTSGIGALQYNIMNPQLRKQLGIERPQTFDPKTMQRIPRGTETPRPFRPQGLSSILLGEPEKQTAEAQAMLGVGVGSKGVSPGFQRAVTGSPIGAPTQDKLLDVFQNISKTTSQPFYKDKIVRDLEKEIERTREPEGTDGVDANEQFAIDDRKKIIKPPVIKPPVVDQSVAEEEKGITGDITRSDIKPKSKEDIAKVINEGTEKEQQDELKQLMQEFTQNAPKYEGLDKGLAIAKIGFAMAAGQSPDAITNIAKALESGADMFIKDKKQKDDFNRQVQLSALKYGLQEKSKIASENRLIAKERRGFKDYVVGPGGTTYRGKRYEANETIPVNIGDIRDGNLPDNLFADTTIAALVKERAAYNKLLADARKNKTIKPAQLTEQIKIYNQAVSDAIDAESGMALIEGAMITVSEDGVVGLSGVVNDAILKGGAFFGMDLTKNYGSKTEVRNAMKAALQKTIPVTLGRTQSANSISNRDVDFLITAYFGEGALDGGILTFATETPTEMVKRLQRAHEQMQNAQKGAFASIRTTEAFLSPLIQPGTTRSAAGLLSADRTRLAEAGLAPGGEEGFGTYVGGKKVVRKIGATRGDDGVIRLDLSK